MQAKITSGLQVNTRLLVAWVSISTIFISGLYTNTPIGVFYYAYPLMAITYFFMAFKYSTFGIRKDIFAFFVLLSVTSVVFIFITLVLHEIDIILIISSLAKVGMLMFFACYYCTVYHILGGSVKNLFKEYLRVAFIFAIIGILQQVVFLIARSDILALVSDGSKDYGTYLGIAGLSLEPAFYACSLLPAGAFYVSEFIKNFRFSLKAVAIISALLMSTSALGYIGLIVAIAASFMHSLNRRRVRILFLSIPIGIVAVTQMINTEFFQLRLKDTLSVINGSELTMKEGMNLSTYTMAVNGSIAMNSIRDNYGSGVGFGLYSSVYDRNISSYEAPPHRDDIPGRGSAASLFFRITAELGVLGWSFLLVIFIWIWSVVRSKEYSSIDIAYLSTFIIILLRMGEYYANGVVLVVVMIHLMRKEIENNKKLVDLKCNRSPE